MNSAKCKQYNSRFGKYLDVIGSVFSYGIVVTALANGTPFYLRRVGLVNHNNYLEDIVHFCGPQLNRFWIPASCHYRRIVSNAPLEWVTLDIARLYNLSTIDLLLKSLKYLLIFQAIGVSFFLLHRARLIIPKGLQLLPVLPLLASVSLSLIIGILRQGPLLAFQGTLTLAWIPLIVYGSWLTTSTQMQKTADAICIIMICQIPLSIIEAMIGLPLPFGPAIKTLYQASPFVPSRLVQSFNHPNTLGIFLVVGFGYYISFSSKRWLLPILLTSIIPLLILARSATGLIVLTIISPILIFNITSTKAALGPKRILFCAGTFLLMLVLLPKLIQRPDLIKSLLGRLSYLNNLLSNSSPQEMILGKGLGIGETIHQQILHSSNTYMSWMNSMNINGDFINTDSMLNLLQTQGGLVAVGSFYSLLIWSMHRDPICIPFLLAFMLCSFTLNVSEIFPLNILLALCINRSLLLEVRIPQKIPSV